MKCFFIIENNSKLLSMLPNDVKFIIHSIEQLETYSFMKKNKAITLVAKTIKKLHIQYDLNLICKKTSITINKVKFIPFLMNTMLTY